MGFILSIVISHYPDGLELHMRETLIPLGFYIVGTLFLLIVGFGYGKMNIYIAVTFFSLYIM
jgi:hypothetical protein